MLILTVLGLWGTVGYRVINRHFFANEVFLEKQNQTNNIAINQISKDTFELIEINRDPFLKKQFNNTVIVPVKKTPSYLQIKKVIAPVIPKTRPNINWPTITYYGYIKNMNRETALVKINEKLYNLRKNDQIEELTIKNIYNDSIEIAINKNTRMIKLNKI